MQRRDSYNPQSLNLNNINRGHDQAPLTDTLLTGGPNMSASAFLPMGWDARGGVPGIDFNPNGFMLGLNDNGTSTPADLMSQITGQSTDTGATGSVPEVQIGVRATLGDGVASSAITHNKFIFGFCPDPNDATNMLVGGVPFVNRQFQLSQQLFAQALLTETAQAMGRVVDDFSAARYSNSMDRQTLKSLSKNRLYMTNLDDVERDLYPLNISVSADHQPTYGTYGQQTDFEFSQLECKVYGRVTVSNGVGKSNVYNPIGNGVMRMNTGCEFTNLSGMSEVPLRMVPITYRHQRSPIYFSSIDPFVNFQDSMESSDTVRQTLFGPNQEYSWLTGGLADRHAGLTTYLVGNTEPRLVQGAVTHYGAHRIKLAQDQIGDYDLGFYDSRWKFTEQYQNVPREHDVATVTHPANDMLRLNANGTQTSDIYHVTVFEAAVTHIVGYIFQTSHLEQASAWSDINDHEYLQSDMSYDHEQAMSAQLEIMVC